MALIQGKRRRTLGLCFWLAVFFFFSLAGAATAQPYRRDRDEWRHRDWRRHERPVVRSYRYPRYYYPPIYAPPLAPPPYPYGYGYDYLYDEPRAGFHLVIPLNIR